MWDAFLEFIFWIIKSIYSVVGDWGMAILVITIIFRLLVWPLMQKQIKSSYQMQKVQPLMQEIQQKYADDPQRMQEEMQKLYAETGFNPVAGCLPILLQMPIFMALFQVLRNMPHYLGNEQGSYEFYGLVPDLTLSPSAALPMGIGTFVPYLILLLIFAGATFAPMIMQQMGQPDNPQRKQTLIMAGVMSIMMLWIGWGSPAGVLLFWGMSSLIGVAQQKIVTAMMKKRDEEAELKAAEEEPKPVSVDVTRKVKKKRPTKNH